MQLLKCNLLELACKTVNYVAYKAKPLLLVSLFYSEVLLLFNVSIVRFMLKDN